MAKMPIFHLSSIIIPMPVYQRALKRQTSAIDGDTSSFAIESDPFKQNLKVLYFTTYTLNM